MIIDSHCHLLHEKYREGDPLSAEQLLRDAEVAGVSPLITIACARDEWAPAFKCAAQHPGKLYVAAGIHPEEATEAPPITMEELTKLASHPQTVAFGETGLDYHYENISKPAQQGSFRTHLHAAKELGLPVVVHTRDAEEDTLAILAEYPKVPFVLHCYTGSRAMALQAVEMGGYISFSGIFTFKKSEDLRALAKELPRDRVLVETDAPYLAPEPVRGRRCTPAMTRHTAELMAKLWNLPLEEAAEITTANTRRLFSRIKNA